MTRRFLFCLILALTSREALAQRSLSRFVYTGTYAGKPAAGLANQLAIITDCADTSCSTGGGSTVRLMRDTGSAWAVLGDGDSGGSPSFASVTAGTNAAALVIGTSGSLTVSGSGTINATSLGGTAAASYALLNSPSFTTPTLGAALATSIAFGADPADAGAIRCSNNATCLASEIATPGTDATIKLNASDLWEFSHGISVPSVTTSGSTPFIELPQGTASAASANSIRIIPPTGITTAYRWILPTGVGATGVLKGSVSSNDATLSIAALVAGDLPSTLTSGTAITNAALTTPSLGVATATSVNKVAITAPATSATLTIADGKTLTASNTITLAGTDSTTMTFPTTSATIFGSTVKNDVLQTPQFCSDAGANDTYACNLSPAVTAYVTGTRYRFKANTANTGAATINFNSVGALTIKKPFGGSITTDLADNDIRAGQWVECVYDGTNCQMTSQVGNAPSGSGTVNSGTAGRLAYYAGTGTAVSDNANLTISSGAVTIGVAGSQAGTLLISGGTSGTTTLAVAAAASGTLTLPAATDTLVGKATTDTLTNKTLDVEGTGNSITTVSKASFMAAGGTAAAPFLLWNTLASNAPTATCTAGSTETTLLDCYASFPDSDGDYSLQVPFMLPSDWTGNIDLKFKWKAAATSGDVVWQATLVCRADAEINDAAFNSANTVTDTAKGTTLQLNDASITAMTTTGCAAGELATLKVLRNRTHASDSITGAVLLEGVEMTTRMAQ